MALNIVLFLISFILLYYGADLLVKGSVKIAAKLNISKVVIGLTIVALGTSMPEFVISFIAGLKGSSDISVGNAVGSCVINITLILGLASLIRPIGVDSNLNKRDLPILIMITVLFCILTFTGTLSRIDGIVLFTIFLIYMFFIVRSASKEAKANKLVITEKVKMEQQNIKIGLAVLFSLTGLALLIGGAQLLVYSGKFIAVKAGMSELAISITLFALGTSLPELFTSVVAAVKGETSISIGNIIGSNIFNLCFVLGFTSIIGPLNVSTRVARFDNFVMLGVSVLLLPFLLTNKKLVRFEGFIFLVIYVMYTLNFFIKLI